jgi:small subunit ribosomal protein S6
VSAISYETVFIAEPEIPTEQVDQIVNKLKEIIATHKGEVKGEDRWGRRRLAYPVRGHREGFYTLLTFTAEPTVVMAMEHLYNVTDTVIRQLTIRHYPSKKKFAPRRERPAGESAHRGPSRGPGMRSHYSSSRPSSAPPAQASAPTAAPAPAAAPAAVEPPSAGTGMETPPAQGGHS